MRSIKLWLDWILNNFFSITLAVIAITAIFINNFFLITLAVVAITAIFMEFYFGLIRSRYE